MNAQAASDQEARGEAELANNASGATVRFQLLHELPVGHDLRRLPLLGAQCRNLRGGVWREIARSWGIASASYDQLGEAWTTTTEFRVALSESARENVRTKRFSGDSRT